MKIHMVLICWLVTIIPKTQSAVVVPYPISPFTDLSTVDKADLEYLRNYARPKRSGSGDALESLKNSIGQGIKSKIGYFAKGSASASSHFSGGGGYHGTHYYHGDSDYGKFDFWSFKKSVLYTLLQAVKAIKGGVIAIKGQLIKGGGQLLATKGKIIKGGGEALSNLGKSIASSAFMIVPQEHGHEEEHYEYIPPSSFGHSAPGPEYGHGEPSGPAHEYGPPGYIKHGPNSLYDGKDGHHYDGIVILKKIPKGHDHHGEESKNPPEFKPISDTVSHSVLPSVKNFVGSMFSASSSLHDYPPQNTAQSIHIQTHTKKETTPPSTSYGTPIGPPVKYLEYFNTPANIIKLKDATTFVTPPPKNPNESQSLDTHHSSNHHHSSYPHSFDPHSSDLHSSDPHSSNPHSSTPHSSTPHSSNPHSSNPHLQNFNDQNYQIAYQLIPQDPTPNPQLDLPTDKGQIFIGMHLPLEGIDNFQIPNPNNPQEIPTPYSIQLPTQFSHPSSSHFLINYPDSSEINSLDAIPQASKMKKQRRKPHKSVKRPQNIEILRSVAFELRPNGPVKL